MTLESALLKQIIANGDFETWNGLKEHYFPEGEYRKLWRVVDKHVHKYNNLPSFEDLKLEIRSRDLQEKIYAIETVETDVESIILLDYLKNQFTQSEILSKIEHYVDTQVAISDAREEAREKAVKDGEKALKKEDCDWPCVQGNRSTNIDRVDVIFGLWGTKRRYTWGYELVYQLKAKADWTATLECLPP